MKRSGSEIGLPYVKGFSLTEGAPPGACGDAYDPVISSVGGEDGCDGEGTTVEEDDGVGGKVTVEADESVAEKDESVAEKAGTKEGGGILWTACSKESAKVCTSVNRCFESLA